MRTMLLAMLLGAWLQPAAAEAQSITGLWDASINTPGGVRDFKILFQVDSGKVTGTVKRPAGDVPLTGTIKGNSLTFSYTIDYNGNALTLTMVATVDGDAMKGTVDFGGAAQDDFAARRSKSGP